MAIINPINSMNQAPFAINRDDGTPGSAVRQTVADHKINTPPPNPLPQATLGNSHRALGQRQAINSSLNEAAISTKVADKTMKTIGARIGTMRSQLDVMIKHYPPFLSSNPDRIKVLRSFSAFRREIDALTIPPQNQGAAKIMADPAVFPQAGNQTIALGNGESRTLQAQQLHTGPTGLNIPALSDTATDAEVHTAIGNLDAAQITLGRRQEGLSMDWATIVPSGKFADTAAEQTSVELGKFIAQNPGPGFTGVRPLLSQLA